MKFKYIEDDGYENLSISTITAKNKKEAWEIVEKQSNSFIQSGFLLDSKEVKYLKDNL